MTPAGVWLIRDLHRQSIDVSELTCDMLLYLCGIPFLEALVCVCNNINTLDFHFDHQMPIPEKTCPWNALDDMLMVNGNSVTIILL